MNASTKAAALLLLGLACAPIRGEEPRPPAAAYEPYGLCAHLTWRRFYPTEPDVERALDLMKDAGVQWIRVGAEWLDLEPEDGKMDAEQQRRVDFVVDQSIRRGIRPYLQFIGTPRWASPKPQEPEFWSYAPTDLKAWARFVGRTAERYRGKVLFWEVNNEIDWPPFWKSGLPAYAAYLKEAAQELRRADPRNRVILGGLATDGVHAFESGGRRAEADALPRLYDLGAGRDFDILGLHPYSQKADGVEISVAKVRTAYDVMKARGDAGKPIWCDEIGLSTNRNPPWSEWTEADQARALTGAYDGLLKLPAVAKVFWYNFRCKGTDPASQEDNFGIVNHDLSPRKAYAAFRDLPKLSQPPRKE